MTVEQTASALVRVGELQEELRGYGSGRKAGEGEDACVRDVMKGRCQSFADVSCDIGVSEGFLLGCGGLSDWGFANRVVLDF